MALGVALLCLFLVRCDELVALAVDVDDLNLVVVFQVLAQLGDVNVHRASVEVVVVNPDGLQCEITLVALVCVTSEIKNKFVLL